MGNLVISRAVGQSFKIGEDITITYVAKHHDSTQIRIAIEAPEDMLILRTELIERNDNK